MEKMIRQEDFIRSLADLLDETFENTRGVFLDRDTSLSFTLLTISAEQASVPVGGQCATLAAQVAHVTFYLEVLERYVLYKDTTPADWGEIWRTVGAVEPEEWERLKARLIETYQRVAGELRDVEAWDEDSIGGAMAILAHSAYHLGEIRQALCTLRG